MIRLGGASAGHLLVVSSGALTLEPTGQDGIFASVLNLARSHVVRSLTAADRHEFLTGVASG